METCVLIPQEFSLVVTSQNNINETAITVWTNSTIEKGKIFYPFDGTVRTDKLDIVNCFENENIRYRFGLYDEITYTGGKLARNCNWIRFIRIAEPHESQYNMICSKVNGEPTYEVVKYITSNQEIVVSFLPEKPEELLYNSLRHCFYRQTMNYVLEGSPLDLSITLLHRLIHPVSPSLSSEDEHKSISGYSSGSLHDNDKIINCKTSVFKERNINSSKTYTPQRSCKNYRNERSLLPCKVCGKAFDRPSLLKRHTRTHTGEKPHICMVCGKGFSTSSSLNTHRRIHSGEKPHQCQVCGKRFTASSNLYYHRMTHIKEKPHKCNICAKSFPTPGDLKSHMYVHSGSWPFNCNICSRGFSKQTNLKNHLLLHTGDKPHVCELCYKKFALACNLRAHLKIHEGNYQNECVR